jgi:hypothetical protein
VGRPGEVASADRLPERPRLQLYRHGPPARPRRRRQGHVRVPARNPVARRVPRVRRPIQDHHVRVDGSLQASLPHRATFRCRWDPRSWIKFIVPEAGSYGLPPAPEVRELLMRFAKDRTETLPAPDLVSSSFARSQAEDCR